MSLLINNQVRKQWNYCQSSFSQKKIAFIYLELQTETIFRHESKTKLLLT